MSFLDPILGPLLTINPFLEILLVSFLLSLLITIIYKLVTDQEVMKTLKQDLREGQIQMKKFKDDPKKMMKIQEETMAKNMKYMMQSMKPTLFTMLPVIMIFGWLSANFAYNPIMPGDEFDTTIDFANNVYGNVEVILPKANNSIEYLETSTIKEIRSNQIKFKFKGIEPGTYDITYVVNNESKYPIQVTVDNDHYTKGLYKGSDFSGKDIKRINVGYKKKIVLDLGFLQWGWLGTYIVLSILFSMSLRKLFKLH